MVNRASVHGLPRRSHPVTPAGSGPPVGAGRCTPIPPMTGAPWLPPASLTGAAIPRAGAWATPRTSALPGPGERVRRTTCRQVHRRGSGAAVPRGRRRVRRSAVKPHRACSPSRVGAGAEGPLERRACHEASPRGFTAVTPSRHPPPPIRPAAGLLRVYGVRETPPLPGTPPPCGNRWHDTLAASSPPVMSSRATRTLVSQ
jgi:hypothetical protein